VSLKKCTDRKRSCLFLIKCISQIMLIMKSKLFTSIVNSNQSKIESAKTIRYPYLPTYSIRHDLNCENSCNHNVKDKDDDKHHILRKRHQYKLLHFVQQQFSVSNHQSGNYPRFRNKDARWNITYHLLRSTTKSASKSTALINSPPVK
jgi:hypothetical protein